MRHSAFLWLHTIRHFPMTSLWHRLRLKVARKLYQRVASPPELSAQWNCLFRADHHPQPKLATRFEQWHLQANPAFVKSTESKVKILLQKRQGELLNEPFVLPENARAWELELLGHTPLWRENYNYLEFLWPLIYTLYADNPTSPSRDEVKNLLEQQLEIFWGLEPKTRYWSTYGVSRRLLTYYECLPIVTQLSDPVQQAFWRNFYQDSRYLAQFPEWDVQGNHLIQNLTAWLAATTVFLQLPATQQLAKQWQNQLSALLPKVFSEQILTDGFHFERTPMYHLWVLLDLLECQAFCEILPNSEALRHALHTIAERMLLAGIHMLPGNGQIPLFGDASLPQSPDFYILAAYAKQVAQLTLPTEHHSTFYYFDQAGFAVFHNDSVQSGTAKASLILDCGEFAPKRLPAHSHCDLGSFELYGEQGPLITDAGVSEYQPSLLRDYFRGTAAHNTVWFPGEEQAEIWGSFRVAEHPRFQGCTVAKNSSSQFELPNQSSSNTQVKLAYTNYNGRYTHQRAVTHYEKKFWVIEDQVSVHTGQNDCWSLLHVHPDCTIEKKNDGFIVASQLLVLPMGAKTAEWSDQSPWRGNLNLFSAGFNLAQTGKIIALSPEKDRVFGWLLVPFQPDHIPNWRWENESLILEFPETHQQFYFKANPT